MDRPTAILRVVPKTIDVLKAMGNLTPYDEPIELESGRVAVGVWTQNTSGAVLDDPEASRIEMVVSRVGAMEFGAPWEVVVCEQGNTEDPVEMGGRTISRRAYEAIYALQTANLAPAELVEVRDFLTGWIDKNPYQT